MFPFESRSIRLRTWGGAASQDRFPFKFKKERGKWDCTRMRMNEHSWREHPANPQTMQATGTSQALHARKNNKKRKDFSIKEKIKNDKYIRWRQGKNRILRLRCRSNEISVVKSAYLTSNRNMVPPWKKKSQKIRGSTGEKHGTDQQKNSWKHKKNLEKRLIEGQGGYHRNKIIRKGPSEKRFRARGEPKKKASL